MSLIRDRCVMWTVTVNDQKSLILVKSDKKLDFSNIQIMLNQIYLENEGKCSWYDRFIDLSCLIRAYLQSGTIPLPLQTSYFLQICKKGKIS